MPTSYFEIEFSKAASRQTHEAAFEQAAMLAEKLGIPLYGRQDDQDRTATIACNRYSQSFDFEKINGVLSVKATKPTY